MIIFSDNLLHVFLRGNKNTDHIAVFVARRSANIGMMLTKSRLQLSTLEANV